MNNDGMIVAGLLVILVIAVINAALAERMQRIVEMKGHSDRVWAWCFWCPMFGIPLAMSYPDNRVVEELQTLRETVQQQNREIKQIQEQEEVDELPPL